MRHVAPERWADAQAERVPAAELTRMNAHAEACARCHVARGRVLAARAAMAAMAQAPAPELPWDSIRAKVRWELSPAGSSGELRLFEETRRRVRLTWLTFGGAAAAAALLVVAAPLLLGGADERSASSPVAQPRPLGAPPSAPETSGPAQASAPQPLVALVTRTRGAVQIDGEAQGLFERPVAAGAVLSSAAGSMDVQLGEGTALTLSPRSNLRVERLDSAMIELSVDGVVDVEVAPRARGQRFLVRSGAQLVEVHGTQFRVEHRADETRVSCRHGLVTVREGARVQKIAAGQVVAVRTGEPMPAPAPLDESALVSLALAVPYRVAWDDAASVRTTTARLELVASADRRVRLDGVELGTGTTLVRAPRGRHLVETSQGDGPFRRAGWAVVGAKAAAVRFETNPEEASRPAGAASLRLGELRARLVRGKLARCVRPLAKQGVSGTFVRVELAVGRDGAIGALNILDTDLPASLAECVRAAVSELRFGPGPAATIVERLEL